MISSLCTSRLPLYLQWIWLSCVIFTPYTSSLRFPSLFRGIPTVPNAAPRTSNGPATSYSYSTPIQPSYASTTIPTMSTNTMQFMEYVPSKPVSILSEQSYVFGNTPTDTERRRPMLTRFLSWALKRVVEGRTEFVSGLTVKVAANSSIDVLRGKVGRVDVGFQKICFHQLYCSGGGRLTIEGLELRMRRLLFKDKQPLRKSYQVFGDLLLTQADVVNSKFIRNLIQLLVNVIVERAFTTVTTLAAAPGMVKINIKRVSIKDQRFFAYGDAILGNSSLTTLAFEVSTGAGIRDNGHVVYLKDIQLVVNPDHQLLRTSVPILLNTPIDIDIGDDCNIISLVFGEKHIWLRARTTISPDIINNATDANLPKKALYRYDLAALLSSLFRMSGGLAVRWVNGTRGNIWNKYRSLR